MKPGFTTLLQNQDLLLEEKKQRKWFCGETRFHNIVAKPGFIVGSKQLKGENFIGSGRAPLSYPFQCKSQPYQLAQKQQ